MFDTFKNSIGFKGLQNSFNSVAPSYLYQPETVAYMTTAGYLNNSTVYFPSTPYEIAGSNVWSYYDNFCINAKNILSLPLNVNNLNTRLAYFYPFYGDTAFINSIDFVTGLSAGNFFGGVSFSGNGFKGNGFDAYFNTNFYLSSLGGALYGYIYYLKEYTKGVPIGTRDGGAADYDYSEISGIALNCEFTTITGIKSVNCVSLYRLNTNEINYFNNGSLQTFSKIYVGASIYPVFINAYNYLGGPYLCSDSNTKGHILIKNPTLIEIQALSIELTNLQILLNRS